MVRPTSYSSHSAKSSASSLGSIYFLPKYMNVPEPEYISRSGATSTIETFLPAENPMTRDVIITPVGLRTVNLFLDYILHEILARTKSTALFRLREGVALVIRTTLGTTAMASAEQELLDHAYIGDTELHAYGDRSDDEGDDADSEWDLDKGWERARIICMVYSVLGDKEQDDFEDVEEEETPEQQLSTAAAIYLAAVLETVAHHCLRVAAKTAFHRVSNTVLNTQPLQLTVEEADIKRGIVEDDLTTRLWRKWKRSENMLSSLLRRANGFPEIPTPVDGAETVTQLPFTPAQVGKELEQIDQKKKPNPDLSSIDHKLKTHSLPLSSANQTSKQRRKSTSERRQRHSRFRGSGDSITLGVSDSIKEALGERGVLLPDSPHFSSGDATSRATSETESRRRHSADFVENGSEPGSPVASQAKETMTAAMDDGLTTPRNSTMTNYDPLKTPTPQNTTQFVTTAAKAKDEDEDCYIIGGDNGLDYSIWETKAPVNERFFYTAPPVGSIKSEPSYEILPPVKEESPPTISHLHTTVENAPDDASVHSQSSIDVEPAMPVEIPCVQMPQESSPAVVNSRPNSDPEVIPGSWPTEKTSTFQSLTTAADDSDSSEHVYDRIANQFAEIERDQATTARVGLGLGDFTMNGMSTVTVTNLTRGPIIINHTELTPIMESSPRESMASETGEPVISTTPRHVSNRSNDIHSSPPPTRQSQSSKLPTSPNSPAVSIHSVDKARTSSLTSQAERLRSKFLNRKTSTEGSFTYETELANPENLERRMKFESLIRSGETMKMTLTPTSLRSIEDDSSINEQRTIPTRVRQQAQENSTRELADFLRSTGPESFLGGTTYERRGSLPSISSSRSPPQVIRSVPSTPIMKNPRKTSAPPLPSKFVPRSPVASDPEHSTLQLAAFIRTTGPDDPSIAPITLGGRNVSEKATTNSIHSNGDSSTSGLLKYQSLQSQRYPPSPSTSTAHGTTVEEDEDDDEDLELSMYPGARRKQKSMPKEESLVDFLRNTGPPEPALPPSPTTPKNLSDKFTGGLIRRMSRSNVKSPEPQSSRSNMKSPEPRGVDIFGVALPRVMSPTPSTSTVRPSQHQLNVNLPSSSLMGSDDYFTHKSPSQVSRQSSVRRPNDPDEIQPIRNLPSKNQNSRLPGPREPVILRSETTDSLAEFLRTTGPSDFGGNSSIKAVKKSKSGFFRRLLGGNNQNDKSPRIQRSGSTSERFTPITIPAVMGN